MRRTHRALLCATFGFLLASTACSTKTGTTDQTKTDASGVKTDIGVDSSSITLGVMTDASAVFKTIGLALTHGNQLWADSVNASGGICGREIKLDVADHGYDAAKAKTLFSEQQKKVVGYVQIVGSPPTAALKPLLVEQNILAMPSGLASSNLDVPEIIMAASSYDIEVINGLAYLQKIGKISDGDKIGHIYIDSEYGQNVLLGSKFYASKHDQTIVESKITGADNDLSASVVKMKSADVKAIILSGTPPQMGSLASLADSMGIPLLGNGPTFDRGLVDSPAKDSFGNYYHLAFNVPFSYDSPLNKTIAQKYSAAYTDPPNDYVEAGYVSGLGFEAILNKACDLKDLTRAGLVKAASQTKADAGGLAGSLDFTNPGEPGTRETLVEQVDPAAPGGLKVVEPLFESAEAAEYKTPFQK